MPELFPKLRACTSTKKNFASKTFDILNVGFLSDSADRIIKAVGDGTLAAGADGVVLTSENCSVFIKMPYKASGTNKQFRLDIDGIDYITGTPTDTSVKLPLNTNGNLQACISFYVYSGVVYDARVNVTHGISGLDYYVYIDANDNVCIRLNFKSGFRRMFFSISMLNRLYGSIDSILDGWEAVLSKKTTFNFSA